jgi:hypothetical protein
MITINHFSNEFSLLELNIDFNKIEPTNYKKESSKTILAISKVIAKIITLPIVVFKNAKSYLAVRRATKKLLTWIEQFEKAYTSATEDQKVELYAALNQIAEMLNNLPQKSTLKSTKGGFFTKQIVNSYLNISLHVNSLDDRYYKMTYPDNGDVNDPEFVKQILAAHAKSNFQHC